MVGSKWQLVAISLVFAVAVFSVYVVKYSVLNSSDQKQSNQPLSFAQPLAASAALTKSAGAKTPTKKIAIYSTPSEHDQLVAFASLDGTNIDGALRADENGNLILDVGVRDFFDYFLSVSDAVGVEQAIFEIQRYALEYLPASANKQVLEVLNNYLRYKQAEYQIQQTPISKESLSDSDALVLLRRSFTQLKETRQTIFTPDQSQALFGLEDIYANHTLSSLEIMADESTSDQQKRDQMSALEAQLPPELSASITQTKNDRRRQFDIENTIASSTDEAHIYEKLSAQGLEQTQIDAIVSRAQQQKNFNAVYQRYQSEKRGLDKNSKHYAIQVTELQKAFFLNPEDLTQAKLRDLQKD